MKTIRRVAMMATFMLFLFGLFGCDKAPKEIDLSSIESITINFETNGSSTIKSIVVDQDLISSIDKDSIKNVSLDDLSFLIPEKEGFVFDNWYFDKDLKQPIKIDSPIIEEYIEVLKLDSVKIDITLYAKWVPVKEFYTITYHLDGGVNEAENVTVYKTTDDDHKLLDPIKEGFSFMGWYRDSDFTTPVTTIYEGSSGDIELWAKWGDASMLTFELRGDVYYVKRCEEDYSGIVVVPSTFNGKPVVGIGFAAFSLCKDLTQVILPESVTVIEASAFSYCDNLSSINIEHVNVIGSSAFEQCDSLQSIVIGDGVTIIEAFTFNSCDNLFSVVLGENVQSIDRQAFSFTPLSSVTLNDGLVSIGESAFTRCHSLSNIFIPQSVEYIGNFAFYECENLLIYAGAISEPSTWESEWNKGECEVLWAQIRGDVTGGDTLYNIVYNLDGGNNHPQNPRTYNGFTDIVLNVPTKYGFVFDGWYTDSALTNSITTIPAGQDSDVNLWASWTTDTAPTYLNYEVFDDYVAITGLNTEVSDIEIPSTYQGKPVTTIIQQAFVYQRDIVSVTLPDTITIIGDQAFAGCTSLTTINFPASLETIGESAFYDAGFIELELPGTITTYGKHVFSNNVSLIHVSLPDNMTVIVDSMFKDCDNLETIDFPQSVEKIEASAFSNCYKLENIDISNVKIIEEYAFAQCKNITSIVLSNDITVIDDYTFYSMDSLVSVILPQNLEIISTYAFGGCSNLTEIVFPQTLTYIGDTAFSGCGLTTLNLPNSLIFIGSEAFKLNDFTNVYIPNSVEYIGEVAFWKCQNLRFAYLPGSIDFVGGRIFRETNYDLEVFIDGGGAQNTWDENWSGYFYGDLYNLETFDSVNINYQLDGGTNSSENPDLLYPCDNLTLMAATKEGYNFKGWYLDSEFTEQVTLIEQGRTIDITLYALWEEQSAVQYNIIYNLDGGKNLSEAPYYIDGSEDLNLVDPTKAGWIFKGWFSDSSYTNQVEVISQDTTEDISLYALWEQNYLIFEEYDDHVEVVGLYMPLTLVEIPSSYNGKPVTVIAYGAFYNERVILEVILPNTILKIETNAFESCENLKKINLPEGLLIIEDSVFAFNKQLKEITIPSTVTSIGTYLFEYDDKLEKVTFNNQMTVFSAGMFKDCIALTEFTVPEGVTEIGIRAFKGTVNLESISLPTSLVKIGSYAFLYTPSLKTIVLPDKLVEIGEDAFSESAITSLILPDSVTSIGQGIFTYNSSLTDLHIGAGLETIMTYQDFLSIGNLKNVTVSPDNPVYYMDGNALLIDNDGVLTLIKYFDAAFPTEYHIPNGVEIIARDAFTYSTLANITIPNTVTEIEYGAFKNCVFLHSIYIPSNVLVVGRDAFSSNRNLTLYVESTEKPLEWNDYWTNSNTLVYFGITKDDIGVYENVMDYVLVGDHIEIIALDNYGGSLFFEIPREIDSYPVTVIRSLALKSSTVGQIIIPDSITIIYEKAFDSWNIDIYCEAASIPEGWHSNWDRSKANVTWDIIWFKYDSQGGDYNFPTITTQGTPREIGYGWVPVKAGYTFDGWYTDKECTEGNEFIFPEAPSEPLMMPTVNTVIYAKWVPAE